MAKEMFIYEEGREYRTDALEFSVTSEGQQLEDELEILDFDRLDGIYCNHVQHAAGEENIMSGDLDQLKVAEKTVLFGTAVGINDVLAVKANIPHRERGMPTGFISLAKGDRIVVKTTDTTPSDNFAAYKRKFYFIFSKAKK